MSVYQLIFTDGTGHIILAEDHECAEDQSAMRHARALLNGRRYLDQVVETAGFANLAGFNDDTRALLSIPARHDVWRREACRFLAGLVAEHRLSKQDAEGVAEALSYGNAKKAYKL